MDRSMHKMGAVGIGRTECVYCVACASGNAETGLLIFVLASVCLAAFQARMRC